MPVCSRPEARLGLALALLLGLAACAGSVPEGELRISHVDALWRNGTLLLHGEQQVKLTAEARKALLHGVPLTIEAEFILRDSATQTRIVRESERFEIRYLPLSEHYRVSGPGPEQVTTFPRLRHALAEISGLDLKITTGALPAGEYQLLVRSRLDHQSMPPPMRLPALFDPAWKHASAWSAWPLTIDPGAG